MERAAASACKSSGGESAWQAGGSFNRCLRYSEEGPPPCVTDIARGGLWNGGQSESGCTSAKNCRHWLQLRQLTPERHVPTLCGGLSSLGGPSIIML